MKLPLHWSPSSSLLISVAGCDVFVLLVCPIEGATEHPLVLLEGSIEAGEDSVMLLGVLIEEVETHSFVVRGDSFVHPVGPVEGVEGHSRVFPVGPVKEVEEHSLMFSVCPIEEAGGVQVSFSHVSASSVSDISVG